MAGRSLNRFLTCHCFSFTYTVSSLFRYKNVWENSDVQVVITTVQTREALVTMGDDLI